MCRCLGMQLAIWPTTPMFSFYQASTLVNIFVYLLIYWSTNLLNMGKMIVRSLNCFCGLKLVRHFSSLKTSMQLHCIKLLTVDYFSLGATRHSLKREGGWLLPSEDLHKVLFSLGHILRIFFAIYNILPFYSFAAVLSSCLHLVHDSWFPSSIISSYV